MLTRPWAVSQALPNPSDQRKQLAAVYTREGIFPDPVTTAPAGIAYPNGGWAVGARQFGAALKRGGAPYTQTYGVALVGNDALGTAWTIPGAPASGSRIDRLWIRASDPTQGEAVTTAATLGEPADRAVPVFGISSGATLPALPAGAFEVAQVTTLSTATSIAQSTITHPYRFAQVVGGIIYERTVALRDTLTDVMPGELCVTLDTGSTWRKTSTGWVGTAPTVVAAGSTPRVGTVPPEGARLRVIPFNTVVTITTGSRTTLSIPAQHSSGAISGIIDVNIRNGDNTAVNGGQLIEVPGEHSLALLSFVVLLGNGAGAPNGSMRVVGSITVW